MSQVLAERIEDSGNLVHYMDSFERHLRLRNRAPRTLDTYLKAVRFFTEFLGQQGMPLEGASLRREHVEAYIEHLQSYAKPATVAQRYRSLQQFFKYLVEEGECSTSPMARMHVPAVPRKLVPIIPDAEVDALLATCAGRSFTDLRDLAMFRLFLDTGVRLNEMSNLCVEDLTLRHNAALIHQGKGRKPRTVSYGDRTAQALERYLRFLRKREPVATERGRALWVGPKGALTDSGISQIVKRRAVRAGIPHINPHRFRHTAAHNAAAAGMTETDLMRCFGWDSSEMPKLYGASAGAERAAEAYRRLGIGNKY